MKQKVYIDTSVIGGCFDEEFKESSLKLFEEFITGIKIAVISDITLDELTEAPQFVQDNFRTIPDSHMLILAADSETMELANQYVFERAISEKYFEDALHIAIASINRVDVLASWNFKHIVNLERIRLYNSVNLKLGYSIIEIRTPREILKSINNES